VEIQGLPQPSNATSTKPTSLRDFVDAYNFARRLKTLGVSLPTSPSTRSSKARD
jgi:hypothetical protein